MATTPEIKYGLDVFKGGQLPGAQYPAASKSLLDITTGQNKAADDYRANMGAAGDKLSSMYNNQARKTLAKSIKQTRNDFNRRGLLRSGLRMGAESSAKAGAASDMDNYRYNLNKQLLGNANQMDANALGSGLLYTGNAPGLGASALSGPANDLSNNISDMEASQKIYGGLFGGLGSGLGTAIARRL